MNRLLIAIALSLPLLGCPRPTSPVKSAPSPSPAASALSTPGASKSVAPTPTPSATSGGLGFAFVPPSPAPGLGDDLEVVVRVSNASDQELVLFPFFELEVLDAKGQEVDTTQNMGRWGMRPEGCFLEADSFLVVPPRESHDLRQPLNFYMTVGSATGWKLKSAGEYRLRFRYAFDRAAYRKLCSDGCSGHDDPTKVWNRAFEGKLEFEGKLVVGP